MKERLMLTQIWDVSSVKKGLTSYCIYFIKTMNIKQPSCVKEDLKYQIINIAFVILCLIQKQPNFESLKLSWEHQLYDVIFAK